MTAATVGHGGGDRVGESGAWASVSSLNGEDHYLPWQPFQSPAEPYRVWDAEPRASWPRCSRFPAGWP
jgi:hypothetical protein